MNLTRQRLMEEPLFAPKGLRALETTGRAVLLHASVEDEAYGTGPDRLLRAFFDTTNIHAEYDQSSRFANMMRNKLVINLARHSMRISMLHEYHNPMHQPVKVFSMAHIHPQGGDLLVNYSTGMRYEGSLFSDDNLDNFSGQLGDMISGYEMILDPATLRKL